MGFVACKNQDKVQGPTDTTSSGVIEISADESFAPVLNQEIDVFENEYDQASIIPIYKSEVDAINLLLQDSVYLAITTRTLTEGENAALEQKKLFAKPVLLATDAVALIINRENPDSLLSVAQLKKYFPEKSPPGNNSTPSPNWAILPLFLTIPTPECCVTCATPSCRGLLFRTNSSPRTPTGK